MCLNKWNAVPCWVELRVLTRASRFLGKLLCMGDLFYVCGPCVNVGSSDDGSCIALVRLLQVSGSEVIPWLLWAWTLMLNVCNFINSG